MLVAVNGVGDSIKVTNLTKFSIKETKAEKNC